MLFVVVVAVVVVAVVVVTKPVFIHGVICKKYINSTAYLTSNVLVLTVNIGPVQVSTQPIALTPRQRVMFSLPCLLPVSEVHVR